MDNVDIGAVNSFVLSGLDENSMYYYRVRPSSNGISGNWATGSFVTTFVDVSLRPTVLPSNIQFTNVSTNSMNLNWTAGNGSGYLVLMKTANNSQASVPEDALYSVGDSLGDAVVVYSGMNSTATSCNISGLTPGTVYYFTLYTDNVSNGNYYFNTNGVFAAQATLTAVQNIPPSNLTFSNISSTTAALSWTAGSGTHSLVLVSTSANNFITPQNGTNYAVNDQVVYNGTGTSCIVNNLTPGAAYYFRVYTYSLASGSPDYYLGGYANGNLITLNPPVSVSFNSVPTQLTRNLAFNAVVNLRNASGAIVSPTAPLSVTISSTGGTLTGTTTITMTSGTGTFSGIALTGADNINSVSLIVTSTGLIGDTSVCSISSDGPAATVPTTQDRMILFTNVTTSGMTINFTAGDGARHLLLVKAETAPAADLPQNGVSYNNNDILSDGSRVVYDGEGTSDIEVTGLNAGTRYYFRAYGYNSNAASGPQYCRLSASLNPRNRYTSFSKEDVAPNNELSESDVNDNTYFVGQVNPNPATDRITFKVTTLDNTYLTMTILDAAGRVVSTPASDMRQQKGTSSYSFDLSSELSSGTYFLVVRAAGQTVSRKFSIVK